MPIGGLAVDPFAGSASLATRVCGRGDRFFGLEAHPLVAELAQVKLSRPGSPAALRDAARVTARRARAARARVSLLDEHELLVKSFAEETLRTLAALRQEAEQSESWAGYLRFATLGVLRDLAGTGWPYPRNVPKRRYRFHDPVDLFLRRADRMADELSSAPRLPQAEIICADARRGTAWTLESESADACISSPPYLNQVAYAEVLRLELYFLGRAWRWADLRALGSNLVTSCAQQVTAGMATTAQARLTLAPRTIAAVEALSAVLSLASRGRSQPKRYDRLLPAYFADMLSVIEHLRSVLRPNARAVWVVGDSAPYGVHVDTPALLAQLAEELGFEALDDRPLRQRGTRWAGTGARHSRLLSERLLVFRRQVDSTQEVLPGFRWG